MLKALKSYKGIAFLIVVTASAGYFFAGPTLKLEKRLLDSGKQHQAKREFKDAADDFERAVRYAPDSAEGLEAARLGGGLCLYVLKDYPRAIFFFRHIVRHGRHLGEVRWAQERLAEIYYEKLNDYNQAITEYQRLLEATVTPNEAADYHLRLARCYYYLANFDQTISEIEEYMSRNPQSPKRFELELLKADALLGAKKTDDAIDLYNKMEDTFQGSPDLIQVKLNKSIAYEDQEDWDDAITELKAIRDRYPHPDVIDLKIRSIEKRKLRKK